MKRKAVEDIGEGQAFKRKATGGQAQQDYQSYFREGLFEFEDQKRQYANSQP